MQHEVQRPREAEVGPAAAERDASGDIGSFCACPVCGGGLMEIRHKLVCSQCHSICETCCEGGRG